MEITQVSHTRPSRGRLWAEFVAFFVGVPLVLALALPPTAMFTVLGGVTIVGAVLLHRTHGFAWKELLVGGVPWGAVAILAVVTLAAASALTWAIFPGNLFALPGQQPALWLMIMILYPFLSALPQELVFRPLFFRRYGTLFPSLRTALGANAMLFSFAHLMYPSPIVLGMTLIGGAVFAWAYAVRGSFVAAVVMHSIAGQMLFTSGLGILFYSGAVMD